ncbi:MAG: DUF4251 domain-containing protein [Ferruginibacter sp.]
MKNIIKTGLIFIFLFSIVSTVKAQKTVNKKEAEIEKLVDSRKFLFIATDVSPMTGNTRNLTSEYDLKILPDTITAYLPYFGRVTSPGIELINGEGGIKFTATNFAYTVSDGKKGRKNIEINIKENIDVRKLSMTIFSNGKANLNIVSNGRQPISYNGYITEIKN